MAILGTAGDAPELAGKIDSLIMNLHRRLKPEPPDVKVNAVIRLAVAYLALSDISQAQAKTMIDGLIGEAKGWRLDN